MNHLTRAVITQINSDYLEARAIKNDKTQQTNLETINLNENNMLEMKPSSKDSCTKQGDFLARFYNDSLFETLSLACILAQTSV